MMRLVLWGCVLLIVPLMYWQMYNDTKFKKNIALGVTFPYEGRSHPQTVALLGQFRRVLALVCLGLVALGVLLALLPLSMGVMFIVWFLWVDVAIVAPMIPYVLFHKKLKALKQAQGWFAQPSATRVVNLTAAAQGEKEASPVLFLLPLAASLPPMVWGVMEGDWLMAALFLTGPVCVALFWALYRWAMRRRAETVDGDETLTQTLTRIRRRAWRRCWVWGAWLMAGVNLCMWLGMFQPLWGLLLLLALTALFLVLAVGLEFHLRHQQERLTAHSGQEDYVDEDEKWIWGMFYYDPNDTHLVVNARVGLNTSVNLARRSGRVILGGTALLLLLMPLFGVWMVWEERSPVTLTLTDTALVAKHSVDTYELRLDDIAQVELLEERPEGLIRVAGTAMDTVSKGRYRSDAYPKLTLCMDPREGPWLLVTMEDGAVYLLGGGASDMEEMYTQLQ